MCTDICTCGRGSQDYLAPDGGYTGACVLTCALVGGILRDSLAPDGGYIGACVLTCVLVGEIPRESLAPMADILGHVY